MSTWPGGIAAITLFAEDLAASRTFYEETLGVDVVFANDDSVVFSFGQTLVNLLDVASAPELIAPVPVADPGRGARAVYTVQVDDVDEACAELQGRGLELENGPVDRPWGPRTASFCDPAGNVWEIAS